MFRLCVPYIRGALVLLTIGSGVAQAKAASATTTTATATAVATTAATDSSTTALTAEELAEIAATLGEAAPPPPSTTSGVLSAVQSMLPDLSFILDVALAAFSDPENNLQSGAHDPLESGFNFQQLELSLTSKVDVYFQLDANLVFAPFGVEVEEAYATSLALPARLQVRAGQFLTRFGRVNATHPHSWDFVDQPFAIGRVFGGEGNRGLGVELSWLTPLPWFAEVLVSSTMAAGEATARSFYGSQDLGVSGPQDLQTTVVLEQFFPFSDDLSLLVGLSGATGPNASGRDNRTDVLGVDLYLRFRPVTYQSDLVVTFQSEWLYRRRQVPRDLLTDVTGYAHTVIRFAPRWAVGARYELGTPARGDLGASADGEVDPLDPEWTSARHRASANLTFWPTEFSRLRLQGSADLPTWRDEPIWAVFLSGEFVIGAHGAHPF